MLSTREKKKKKKKKRNKKKTECQLFPRELGSHRAALPFPLARVKLFRMWTIPQRIRGPPGSDLILMKREKYFSN